MSVKGINFDLSNMSKEKMVTFMSSLAKLQSAAEMFIDEYRDVLPLYSGKGAENSHIYAGLTLEQMEEVSMADVAYAILKNVEAISEHLDITLDKVVEKSLESTEWYKKALNDALAATKTLIVPQISYPSKILYGKDALIKDTFQKRAHGESRKVKTAQNVSIYYGLLFNDEYLTEKLTAYDRIVYAAIVSLVAEDVYIFKISQLYRVMNGNKGAKPTKKQIERISESIWKMHGTRIQYDLSEESALKKWDIENPKGREGLLNVHSVYGLCNGEYDEYIEVLTAPLLYKLNQRNGQMIRIDPLIIDIPKLHKTDRHLILEYYLYEQIERMEKMNVSEDKSNILYEKIYEHLEMQDATPAERKRLRDTITTKILPYWIGTKTIKSFEEVYKGRTPEKIKIIYK